MLDEFVGAILLEKPDDIVKFGEQFFSSLSAQDRNKVSSVPTASVKEPEEDKIIKNVLDSLCVNIEIIVLRMVLLRL